MATLHKARVGGPEGFNKFLAVKTLHPHHNENPEIRDMFIDEARISARINHHNVASTIDFGEHGGIHYIVMEYVRGRSLLELLIRAKQKNQPIPWPSAAFIAAEAAAGLHGAHEAQSEDGKPLDVVHRDVSPGNILISEKGHVKVVDFGVARASDNRTHTVTGTIKGKLSYLSPEQAEAKPLDRRSDIFSLGIVLFEMVCLKQLFTGESEPATLRNIERAEIPSPKSIRPDIPDKLERIILTALERDVLKRYATARALSEDLKTLLLENKQGVSDAAVADLMKDLFDESEERTDANPQDRHDAKKSIPIASAEEHGSRSAPTKILPDTPPATRRSKRGAIGAFVLIAIIAGIVSLAWYFLHGRPPAMKPQQAAPADAPPIPDASAPTMVRLSVKILPHEAKPTVVIAGKTYHGRTFDTSPVRSDKHVYVNVSAPGYASQNVNILPKDERTVSVTLLEKGDGNPPTPDAAGMVIRPRPMRARARPQPSRPRRRPVRRKRLRPRPRRVMDIEIRNPPD